MVALRATSEAYLTSAALTEDSDGNTNWLWEGVLARRMVSLLTSRWKSGKTTLLSILLGKMAAGGELAGGRLTAGTVVVVSEEPREIWAGRVRSLGLGPNVLWRCRPFRALPTVAEWQALVAELAAMDVDLYVFDPLAMVLPGDVENNASAILRALEPLHALTEKGAAVLLLHHPRKAAGRGEFSPRGSGALTGFADILLELERPWKEPPASRVRQLRSASRVRPPGHVTMVLNDAGTDYAVLPEPPEADSFEAGWAVLKTVLEDADHKLTRESILKAWPADHDKPGGTTLRRWLDRAVKEGLAAKSGLGRTHRPFRFALPGRVFPSRYPADMLEFGPPELMPKDADDY